MLGAVEKGTSQRLILFPAPFKLVAASGKPPPESLDEIRHVRILRQVRSGCQLMADGAMGWSGAAKEERKRRKVNIRVTHVKHSQGQFTKKVAARLRRNRLGGTQVLDRMWDSLKRTLPRSLSTRTLSVDSLRLRLQRYVWMWYWRHKISSEASDVLEKLGALMSKVNKALGYWK